jgi:nucleotide-binding universal stress UspA family protein
MIPYKKILITTDGSEKTGPAIYYGLWIAKVMGAEVTAMCVIDEVDYGDVNVASPEAEMIMYQRSAAAVQSIVIRGKAAGVKVRPLIVGGIPASEIAQVSIDYDLTIMGTVGRTGLPHLVLGSVAEKVVRSAQSPVLVVHSGVGVESGAPSVKKVLIPTDGSESTKPAITHGLAMAKAFNAEVTALSVAHPEPASVPAASGGVGPITMEGAREATEQVVEEGRKRGVIVTPMVLTGMTPSAEILKAAADHDLIVMGTVGRTGLAHIRLGSVAEETVRQAKCPVLVVRAK